MKGPDNERRTGTTVLVGRTRKVLRRAFDVRPGEYLRTLFMGLYLLFVLFAYYILKPVSRALFLNRFDIDRLPYLYILIAVAGGLLAYVYTKLSVKTSLGTAVSWTMGLAVACLAAIWWLIRLDLAWVYYVFSVWVSLFSIVLVSQGWLVAANVFDAREAKRLYGLLGLGAVVGAAFGGSFTAFTVRIIGTRNLLLASAAMVVLAYAAFRLAIAQRGVSLAGARAGKAEEAELQFRDIVGAIGRHRHLQVIIGIILLTFIVDVLVEFQFSYLAKATYKDARQLTAFLGSFYGIYLNLLTFVLQFFLTALIVGRFGVGGTLQIMPVSMAAVSTVIIAVPGIFSAAAARLAEAASRYTFNRTGMELLYLPLPTDLRNRTKAFVDIFVDRLGRGFGGMFLAVLTAAGISHPREISVLVIGFSILWIVLSRKAQKEYVLTVRRRIESRRLDLAEVRLGDQDPGTLTLLEQTARGTNPRQARYALSLLAEVPGFKLEPLLSTLAASRHADVRSKVYELAGSRGFTALLDVALAETGSTRPEDAPAIQAAVGYVLSMSPDALNLAKQFLGHSNPLVAESALDALGSQGGAGNDPVSFEWITEQAKDVDPQRRRLAALAVGMRGDHGTEVLHRLLEDAESIVVAAACRAAGALGDRAYLPAVIRRLAEPRLRCVAIEALARYGTRICGTLGDLLEDEKVPAPIRRQIPRVLQRIPEQRSVDVLLRSIGQPDLSVRGAVLRALNRVREAAPNLDYGASTVTRQILEEARQYFELQAVLETLGPPRNGPRTATALLRRTIGERLLQILERLFHLLGLRYPPKEMYAAYRAVNQRRGGELAAALEFLDNILDRELKRVLLPLLDAPTNLTERGHELFGIEIRGAESALRKLIGGGDPWLAACSMAAASELRLHRLAPAITQASALAGRDVMQVAQSAAAALG